MQNRKNTQLILLVLLLLGVSGFMVYLIGGDRQLPCRDGEAVDGCSCVAPRQVVDGRCNVAPHVVPPVVVPGCSVSAPCPDGNDCIDGECLPSGPVQRPTCVVGQDVTTCTCRPPMVEDAGHCTAVSDRCSVPVFQDACRRVQQACAGKGIGCEGKKWSDLEISDNAVGDLMHAFDGQIAMLFPSNKPDGPVPVLKAAYKTFLIQRWSAIQDAKTYIILGRASRTGSKRHNESLAIRRMSMVEGLLYEICIEKVRAGELDPRYCIDSLKSRGKSAAIGYNRTISATEFSTVFQPLNSRSVAIKNWMVPSLEIEGVVVDALSGTAPNGRVTKANEYMNQAVFIVPIPCDCHVYAPSGAAPTGQPSGATQ